MKEINKIIEFDKWAEEQRYKIVGIPFNMQNENVKLWCKMRKDE